MRGAFQRGRLKVLEVSDSLDRTVLIRQMFPE
jgi:hypothetical protein